MSVTIASRPRADFVETPYIAELSERGLGYLGAGFGLNLEGHAGSGKTTLAFHIASKLERPIVLVSGDDSMESEDLVGRMGGFRRRKLVDNFIHSVLKVEEEGSDSWIDERLTIACREGYTLIYDEFTRSRAEANNVLLPVLEEGVLVMPSTAGGGYVRVHPNFRAIFTSNPEDYAGVHRAQEALRDRMVTIELGAVDFDTELAIVSRKSALSTAEVTPIVAIVRAAHHAGMGKSQGSIRTSLQIAKVAAVRKLPIRADNPTFKQVIFDVLGNSLIHDNKTRRRRQALEELIDKYIYVEPEGSSYPKERHGYSQNDDEASEPGSKVLGSAH